MDQRHDPVRGASPLGSLRKASQGSRQSILTAWAARNARVEPKGDGGGYRGGGRGWQDACCALAEAQQA